MTTIAAVANLAPFVIKDNGEAGSDGPTPCSVEALQIVYDTLRSVSTGVEAAQLAGLHDAAARRAAFTRFDGNPSLAKMLEIAGSSDPTANAATPVKSQGQECHRRRGMLSSRSSLIRALCAQAGNASAFHTPEHSSCRAVVECRSLLRA